MVDDKNPHEIIQLINKPKEWREKASIILIQLWEYNHRIAMMQKSIIALLTFVIALLLKLIFFP